MKIGDLVNFHPPSYIRIQGIQAKARYASPGVILSVEYSDIKKQKFVSDIVWADGQITREYDSYLRLVKGNNDEHNER